jgi:hypothetical protein
MLIQHNDAPFHFSHQVIDSFSGHMDRSWGSTHQALVSRYEHTYVFLMDVHQGKRLCHSVQDRKDLTNCILVTAAGIRVQA